jgi:protein TonB
MNPHLSSRSISKYLADDGPSADIRHVRECPSCRAELSRLEASLAHFREFMQSSDGIPARRVSVKTMWGLYPPQKKSWLLSLAFQTLAVAMVFTVASSPAMRQAARDALELYVPVDITNHQQSVHGGGGGGDRSPLPASKGKFARPARRPFTPPSATANNPNPKLIAEPTIVVPPDVTLPQIAANDYGDPLSKLGLASNGPGTASGIGSGSRGGIGPGDGPGAAPGFDGGIHGGVFRAGRGVTAPLILYKVEPEYSEQARKAKYQGVVVLRVIIDPTGRVIHPVVVQSLGLGLDEKAIEAVQKWRFRPGYKDGKPVAVFADVEVSFRLL